jgi:XTP/dITP diphosphohydrolase
MTLYCATSNAGKLREFRLAASEVCTIEPVPGLSDIGPPDETGATFEANAVQKALYYAQYVDGYLFAEDSGLEVDALGGEPGVYSARYAGANATDEQNNALLLERLGGRTDRSARFVCTIALVRGERVLSTFRGTVEGEILHEPCGLHGFGYDPLFYYPPFGCSFGEVPGEQKQTVSHRGAALRKLLEYVRSL